MRKDFISGHFKLNTEDTVLDLKQYNNFLKQHADSIHAFKTKQKAAFEAERQRWAENQQASTINEDVLEEAGSQSELDLPDGAQLISSQVTGTVWKLLVKENESIEAGKPLAIIESMKMEFTVESPVSGKIRQIFCQQGSYIAAGQTLMIVQEA